MKRIRVLFTAVSLGFFTTGAYSQCATGVNTGGGNCVPPDAAGMPDYRPPDNSQPRLPPPVWADSWGAIVLDIQAVAKGVSTDKSSKAEAIRAAMDECEAMGATNCKVELTYYNQCAAVAWGNQSFGIANSPSIEGASEVASSECSRRSSSCKVVYTACSLARRVQ